MTKKFFFVAIIALVAVLAYGVSSTGAWFTDSAKIENNAISSGNLDLTVWGGPFQVSNLEPGGEYRSLGVFCAKNEGDYDMKWRGYIKDFAGSTALKDKLYIQAIMNPTGAVGNYGPSNATLFTDVSFNTLTNPANGIIVTDDPTWAFTPGSWACYDIQVKLSSSAGNIVQGKSLTATLHLDATQRINTGWNE